MRRTGLCLVAALLVSGCSTPPARVDTDLFENEAQPIAPTGSLGGLETRVWRVLDEGHLAGMLTMVGAVETLSPDHAAVWRRAGLVFVQVPLSRLADLRRALIAEGPAFETWHGQRRTWTTISSGPPIDNGRWLLDGTGERPVVGERLLFEVRGWTLPGVAGGGDVTLGARVSSVPLRDRVALGASGQAPRPLRGLNASWHADPEMAYLIAPVAAGAPWPPVITAGAPTRYDRFDRDVPAADAYQPGAELLPGAPPRGQSGPPSIDLVVAGHTLLGPDASGVSSLVVLIGREPERFRLIDPVRR
ncbi:MAG: hypothetical protein AAGB51_08155 [Planctomycetota bacterium]